MSNFVLKSPAIKEGGVIPTRHTCDGDDVNPFLEISGAPEGTKSFVLIVHDPDAPGGDWVHWVLWNIPPQTRYIPEDGVPSGAMLGTTSFQEQKYGGPCPPKGHGEHHYVFTLYALDAFLDLSDGAFREDVERAIESHILATTTLTGLYERKKR